jgi:hypothetical protein
MSESDSETDPYAVQVRKTNKDEMFQPHSATIGLLPTLPTGIVVIGRSGSGKTQAVVTMLTNKRLLADTFDYVYLFTGVKPDKELIADLELPPSNIKVNFEESAISTIMKKMEATVDAQGFKNTPSVLFVFDDILGNVEFLKSNTLTKLATTNRHMNISYIIMSQYYKKLPAVVRTNASFYMIFPSSDIEIQKIADELTPPSMSKKQFLELARHATKARYSFLSINSKADPSKQLRRGFNTILN